MGTEKKGYGWLSDQDIDMILQLFNIQANLYPSSFKKLRWTCMGAHYNSRLKAGLKDFLEKREIDSKKDISEVSSNNFIWQDIDDQLYNFPLGNNQGWQSMRWDEVDFVYGVEHIGLGHWGAYEYDLKNKIINVYDSMHNRYHNNRKEAMEVHAILLPSLLNICYFSDEDKLYLDVPFKLNYVDCPRQTNELDCGVYACKFVQCQVMDDSIFVLLPKKFANYRKKIVQDLLKWTVGTDGKVSFEETKAKSQLVAL